MTRCALSLWARIGARGWLKVGGFFDAVQASNKILHTVRHQDHFNFPVLPNGGRGPRTTTSIDLAIDWLKDEFQA